MDASRPALTPPTSSPSVKSPLVLHVRDEEDEAGVKSARCGVLPPRASPAPRRGKDEVVRPRSDAQQGMDHQVCIVYLYSVSISLQTLLLFHLCFFFL